MISIIRSDFEALINEALTLALKEENKRIKPVLGEPYAQFKLGAYEILRLTQGLKGIKSINGTAQVILKVDGLSGTDKLDQLQDALTDFISDNPLYKSLHFNELPTVDTTVNNIDWCELILNIPYISYKGANTNV